MGRYERERSSYLDAGPSIHQGHRRIKIYKTRETLTNSQPSTVSLEIWLEYWNDCELAQKGRDLTSRGQFP